MTRTHASILSGITIDFEDRLHHDTAYYSLQTCGFSVRSLPGCQLAIDVREGDDAFAILDIVKAAIEQNTQLLRRIEERVRRGRPAPGPCVSAKQRNPPRFAMPDDPTLAGE